MESARSVLKPHRCTAISMKNSGASGPSKEPSKDRAAC